MNCPYRGVKHSEWCSGFCQGVPQLALGAASKLTDQSFPLFLVLEDALADSLELEPFPLSRAEAFR